MDVILPVFDVPVPTLLLGPLLRHVDTRSATVWVIPLNRQGPS
jgi:hypothetical protein